MSAAARFLQGNSKRNAIEVLPTGSGKSLIIANIVKYLNAPTLIFQPSKEILEQNFAKLLSYGFPASIYSASFNSKRISNITFATIGSVIRKKDLFREFRYVIVDECHFVNSKGGMYQEFLTALEGVRILGLTATPYRLTTDGFGGSILKFLTRTRPRIFHDLIFYIQNGELFRTGYLAKLQYNSPNGFNRLALKANSTGADYTDQSVKDYYQKINFKDRVVSAIRDLATQRKNVLVFTRFIEEAQYIMDRMAGVAAIVTGETPKKDREKVISDFRSGRTRVVCNCGVLVTGFDYPELECIVIAQPTMSLARYYQMIGRGIRPHPEKPFTSIVDLCGNTGMFGKVEDLIIQEQGERSGKWVITSNGRQLTNIYYGERVGSTWK